MPGFAGREAEIAALEEALWRQGGTAALTNAPTSAAAVKGLGGVGKSVLAREYAWRNRARYQGVWWVRAERRETLADDLIELGTRFIPSLKQMPERDRAARRALDSLEQAGFEKPWLLVYDNVEEPGQIEGLAPRTGVHVLLTTRWSDWGRTAAPVEVGVFPPDVAASFLLEGAGRSDREGAERLAAALGHLPLALDHAAAYIRRTGIDFATYEALAADLLRKASRGVDYDTPVFATFSLAIDKASEACPEAQKLMGLCAFLAPDRIPLSLFTADVLSEIARAEAVAALQEVSLVTLEPLDDGSPSSTYTGWCRRPCVGGSGTWASTRTPPLWRRSLWQMHFPALTVIQAMCAIGRFALDFSRMLWQLLIMPPMRIWRLRSKWCLRAALQSTPRDAPTTRLPVG